MADHRPPDQAARDRIVAALDRDLLVEAGAGSGKTTAMVERMVALISTGSATIDQLVAVTFTRKAAGELRERFQEKLEDEFRNAEEGSLGAARAALDQLDSCFLGNSRVLRSTSA
jgi:ATP-dependent helicase/nuclease subunit A